MMKMTNDLDEVLSRDTEGKITWLVSEVSELKTDIHIIKENHLSHIEKDMATLKNGLITLGTVVVTILTGTQVM